MGAGFLPSTVPENSHTIWCLFDPPFAIGYFPSLRRQFYIYIYIRSTTKQGFQSPTPQKQEEPEVLLGQNVLATTLLFPNFAGKKKNLLEVNWQLAGMAGPMYFPIVMVVYQRVEITNWSTISLPQLVGTRVVYQIPCFNQQHCSELKTLWTCSRLLQNASTSLSTWL